MSEMTAAQTKSYLMKLWESFYWYIIIARCLHANLCMCKGLRACIHCIVSTSGESEGIKEYKAVSCTGLQEEGSIYVFGPTLQFTNHGMQIPLHEQKYVWVDSILLKLKCRINPLKSIPAVANPLNKTMDMVRNITGDNSISAAFLLGKFNN